MGKGDFFGDQQFEQGFGYVVVGVYLFYVQQCCYIGYVLGVYVKYGCDWYVDVVLVEMFMFGIGQCGVFGEGMQYQLLVREIYFFGQIGGIGGVKGGGVGVFVQFWKIEFCWGLLQQSFVFVGDVQLGIQVVVFVIQQYIVFYGFDVVFQFFENWQKFLVYQNYIVFGVVEGVENLFWVEVYVYCVQYCVYYGNGKECFQVMVGVLVYYCYGVVGFDFVFCQCVGELVDLFFQILVVYVMLVCVDDFLFGSVMYVGFQNVVDYQW